MDARVEPLSRGLRALAARPARLLGRGGAGDRLDRAAARQIFDPERRRLRPLVRRRRLQHLLQRGRPPRRRRPRRAGRDHLRLAARRHQAHHHLSPRCRPRRRCSPPSCADFGVGKGDRVILYMPMVPEAVIGDARLRAHRRDAFGGVRRLCARSELATRIDDAKPKVILSASCGIEPGRVVAYKPLLDEAIELAQHKPDACLILQRPQAEATLDRRPRPRLAASCATRRSSARKLGLRLRAGRRDRSALHPLHLGHDRHARRAWCATTAATWSRSNGR